MSKRGKTHRNQLGGRRDAPRRSMWSMEAMIRAGHVTREASCSNKIAYTVGGADAARRSLRKKKKRTSIYHCRFCGGYHLTSMVQ